MKRKCKECDGSGTVDDAEPYGMTINEYVCKACKGHGSIVISFRDRFSKNANEFDKAMTEILAVNERSEGIIDDILKILKNSEEPRYKLSTIRSLIESRDCVCKDGFGNRLNECENCPR